MVRLVTITPILRWFNRLRPSLVVVAALTSFVALLYPYEMVLHLRVLYVLVSMLIAGVWATALATAAAVLSIAVYTYLFLPPIHSFAVSNLRKSVGLDVVKASVYFQFLAEVVHNVTYVRKRY